MTDYTNYPISLVVEKADEYYKYKDLYIEELKVLGGDYNDFKYTVDILSSAVQRATLAHSMYSYNLFNDINSSKQKKIDPYIAAGAGTAVGGLAGGLIAGGSAIKHNVRNEQISLQDKESLKQSRANVNSIDKEIKELVSKLDILTELYQSQRYGL